MKGENLMKTQEKTFITGNIKRLLVIMFVFITVPVISFATTYKVGSTDPSAETYLQTALDKASSGDVIKIAQGTYYPDNGTNHTDDDRSEFFDIPEGITVKGGYEVHLSGSDYVWTYDPDQYTTTLSGEIQQNGTWDDNSYNVVTISNTSGSATTTVQSCTIKDGYAWTSQYSGAGIDVYTCSAPVRVKNCIIEHNGAETAGAGIYITNSDPNTIQIEDCTIKNNTVWGDEWLQGGGGVCIDGIKNESSLPVLLNTTIKNNESHSTGGGLLVKGSQKITTIQGCTISDNTVYQDTGEPFGRGGGIYCIYRTVNLTNCTIKNNQAQEQAGGIGYIASSDPSDPVLEDCIIKNNDATGDGGGIWNVTYSGASPNHSHPVLRKCFIKGNESGDQGGGFYNKANGRDANPDLINCVISGNQAAYGGGFYNESVTSDSEPTLFNCTLTGNKATQDGGAVYNFEDGGEVSYTLTNCILWQNNASGAGNEIYHDEEDTEDDISYSITYCDIEEGQSGFGGAAATGTTTYSNNINSNPGFTTPIDPSNAPTDAGDFSIPASPSHISCIGVGTSSGAPSVDIDGNTRPTPAGSYPDMGAYEHSYGEVTWQGNTNSMWDNSANWDPQNLPGGDWFVATLPGTSNVVVDNDPGSPATCEHLIMNADATLTINAGKALTIAEDLTVATAKGAADLTIASDASGTGSLIVNGTASGDVTVQRYLTDAAWHFITPPVYGATAEDFYWNDNPQCWITQHSEAETGDDAWTYITDLSTTLNLGQGYSIWLDESTKSNATGTMTGEIQTSDYSPGIDFTDDSHGFNLVGNPFTSAVDFQSGTWGLTNMESTIWIWKNSENNYVNRTQAGGGSMKNGIIPEGQGFFVRATASSPTLTIPANAKTHNSQSFYKKADHTNGYSKYLILEAIHENGVDEVWVSFGPEGTPSFDNGYDASKLFGGAKAPQLYLTEQDRKLSIDYPPTLGEQGRTVALNYVPGTEGEQTLSADFTHLTGVTVKLEDLDNGTVHDLKQDSLYTFAADTADTPDRFLLHFNKTDIGIDETTNNPGLMKIYAHGHHLYIRSQGKAARESGRVEIYDTYGQLLSKHRIRATSLANLPVHSASGYVIAKVIKPSGVKTGKILIK
ncbi:MAG: right-handed parallel beta-helix repeat-containing protein [Bacteroidales bacterium]|nr:right-handed parallel beta-helix repeat-containing protein [Bacteroidales bacterium]